MKKLIALLLTMAMLLSAMPMGVIATEEETEDRMPVTKLYVGSVNALETPHGDGWSFDAENGVLTLNNCTLTEDVVHTITYDDGDGDIYYDRFSSIIYFTGDLTIELIGNNFVEQAVQEEPADDTQCFTICAAIYETVVDGEVWDMPSKLAFRGAGNLTTGIAVSRDAMDEEGYSMLWDHLNFSAAIGCWAEGGADLSGLHSGGWMEIYGGIYGVEAPWIVKAFACSPTFGSNAIVTAFRDVEGTVENEFGYNWNNNDAWRMKVVTADAHLNSKGLLTLLDSGAASGQGWTWENNVLTLSSDTEVKAVEFRAALGSAKLKLAGNVTLDCTDMGYDSNWNMIPCINANCDLEIDAGAYTLTFTGDTYTVLGNCADIMISGGTVEEAPEYSNGIYINGGGLTIQDASFRSSGGIEIWEGWDADGNTIPGGDILIQNASVTLDSPIGGYGNIATVINSDLTITWGYSCIYAPNGIYLQDSNITLIASGIALDTNKTVSIDNCNLNIVSEQEVISCGYVSNDDPNTEADLSKLSLSNMNITEPAGYQIIAETSNNGSKEVKLANSDGTLATTLIAKATQIVEKDVASVGDNTFASLQEAFDYQLAQGAESVSLSGDLEVESLTLPAGGVLNLNGYALTAASVDATVGDIVDESENATGVLSVSGECEFDENNPQLPVYDSEKGGYRFFKVTVESVAVTGNANPKYWFRIKIENFDDVHGLIDAGSAVDIKLDITVDGVGAEATAQEGFVESWADAYGSNDAVYITVSAVSEEAYESISVIPALAANGVAIQGEEL